MFITQKPVHMLQHQRLLFIRKKRWKNTLNFIAKNHSSEAALLSQQLSTETPQEGSRRFLHSCGLARQLGAPSHSHRSVAHRAEQILSLQTSDGRTFLRHTAPQRSTVQCNSSHFQSLFNWLGITESKRTLRVKRNRVSSVIVINSLSFVLLQ